MNKIITALVLTPMVVFAQYSRNSYGVGWPSVGNGCNVRTYVLAKFSINKVGCKDTKNGIWVDPYTGDTIKSQSKLDIDHVVPLGEVDKSGGSSWSKEEKHAYYTDTARSHLLPVSSHENRAKGDMSITEYLPPNEQYRSEYCRIWYTEKKLYKLTVTKEEEAVLIKYLGTEYKMDLQIR